MSLDRDGQDLAEVIVQTVRCTTATPWGRCWKVAGHIGAHDPQDLIAPTWDEPHVRKEE